jgi:hypothetical protein
LSLCFLPAILLFFFCLILLCPSIYVFLNRTLRSVPLNILNNRVHISLSRDQWWWLMFLQVRGTQQESGQ